MAECRLARLDFLIKRRPELLSSVMLRQNPHNVHEWHKRVKLFDGQPERQISTYAEAVREVDPEKVGSPSACLRKVANQQSTDDVNCYQMQPDCVHQALIKTCPVSRRCEQQPLTLSACITLGCPLFSQRVL